MTDVRISELSTISVDAALSNPQISELATTQVLASFATPFISQLFTVIVAANNVSCVSLGPVFGLGCWSPCGTLIYQSS